MYDEYGHQEIYVGESPRRLGGGDDYEPERLGFFGRFMALSFKAKMLVMSVLLFIGLMGLSLIYSPPSSPAAQQYPTPTPFPTADIYASQHLQQSVNERVDAHQVQTAEDITNLVVDRERQLADIQSDAYGRTVESNILWEQSITSRLQAATEQVIARGETTIGINNSEAELKAVENQRIIIISVALISTLVAVLLLAPYFYRRIMLANAEAQKLALPAPAPSAEIKEEISKIRKMVQATQQTQNLFAQAIANIYPNSSTPLNNQETVIKPPPTGYNRPNSVITNSETVITNSELTKNSPLTKDVEAILNELSRVGRLTAEQIKSLPLSRDDRAKPPKWALDAIYGILKKYPKGYNKKVANAFGFKGDDYQLFKEIIENILVK